MAHESVKGILFFSCTLLLFAVDALAQPADPHWKRYTIRREEFSVKLPEHPAMGHGAVEGNFFGGWRGYQHQVVVGVALRTVGQCDRSREEDQVYPGHEGQQVCLDLDAA